MAKRSEADGDSSPFVSALTPRPRQGPLLARTPGWSSAETAGGRPMPLIPVQDLRTMLRQVGYDAASLPALLERLRLPPSLLADPGDRVDPRQVWFLCSALGVELGDEKFGLATRPVPPGATELLVSRAMHGATLGDAMDALAESAPLVQDLRFNAKRGDDLHFGLSVPNPDSAARQILLELTVVPLHCTLCWLAGAALPVRRLRTAAARRRSRAPHFLAAILGCRVEFGGTGADIVYPRAVADLPVVARDLRRWRTDMLGILLDTLERRGEARSDADATRHVERALRDGITDLGAVASSAGMSVATLRRKLWRECTSFRALRDRILAETARQHIDSDATVEEIAARLGYSDARSFRRAFRRVFGEAPADYRSRSIGPRWTD